jgi:hypothetical protein
MRSSVILRAPRTRRSPNGTTCDVLAHNLARTMRALLDALSQAAGEGGPPSAS